MHLLLMTSPEVETYLKRSTGIIIPIGSVEQHGPTGVLGVDAICACAVATQVGDLAPAAIVGPVLPIGMAQYHLAFAGTITLRPTTLIAYIRDVVESLSRAGFRKFFFINGHNGNQAVLRTAFQEIYTEFSLRPDSYFRDGQNTTECRLKNWWETKASTRIVAEKFGIVNGEHASPSEISIAQSFAKEFAWRAPQNIPMTSLQPVTTADDFARKYPQGVVGADPNLATAEIGERLVKEVAAEIVEEYRSFAN